MSITRSVAFSPVGAVTANLTDAFGYDGGGAASPDFFIDGTLQRPRFTFNATDTGARSASLIAFSLETQVTEVRAKIHYTDTITNNIVYQNDNSGFFLKVQNQSVSVRAASGAVTIYTGLSPSPNVPYQVTVLTVINGDVKVTFSALDFSEADQTQTLSIFGSFPVTNNTLHVGESNTPTAAFVGQIWDLEIDKDGTPAYAWPMNDETSPLVASVGGVNLTLVAGTGTWNSDLLLGDGLTETTAWSALSGLQVAYDADATAMNSKTAAVNRGSQIDSGNLALFGTSGFALEAYGSGADPIIERKQVLAASVFTLVSADKYSMTSINGGAPFTRTSLVINGVWMDQVPLLTDLNDTTQTHKYFLDTTTGLQTIITTEDPTVSGAETAASGIVIDLGSLAAGAGDTTNLKVKDLDIRHGKHGLQVGNGYVGVTLTNTNAKWVADTAGNNSSVPIYFPGSLNSGAQSAGLVMNNCTLQDSSDQLFLFNKQKGSVFNDCLFDGAQNTCNEWFENNNDITFNRCKFMRLSQGVIGYVNKFTGQGAATYDNIKFINCLFYLPYRPWQSSSLKGSPFMIAETNSVRADVKLINCTLFSENRELFFLVSTLQANQVRMVNCILAMNERVAAGFAPGQRGYMQPQVSTQFSGTSTAWGDDVDTNNNLYYQFTAAARQFNVSGVNKTLTQWQALTGSPDANSIEGTGVTNEPKFVRPDANDNDVSGPDFKVLTGSAAIGRGSKFDSSGTTLDPDVPTVDIDKKVRDMDNITAGCYQFVA